MCGYKAAHAVIKELAGQNGYEVVPSYDDQRIICGQGTLGLEITEQWGELAARPTRGNLHR